MLRASRVGILAAAALAAVPAAGSARDLRSYGPSTLLSPGESELKIFNNLYTQTRAFDDDGDAVDAGGRSTWYTGSATLRAGWKPRVNAAIEMTVRAVKDETRPKDFWGRSGLTAVTPWIQFAPVDEARWLSVQTGVRFPLGSNLEGDDRDPFLDFADPSWIAKGLADLSVAADWRVYLEAGGSIRMAGDDSQLTTPLKAIVTWEPSTLWSLYAPTEIAPDWWGDSSGDHYTQVGIGGKLRPGTGNAELEALWTVFPIGRNKGAGQTFNLGVRFVR
jgi:hypothetical protein